MKIKLSNTSDIARDWVESDYYGQAEQPAWVDVFWHDQSPFYLRFKQLSLDGTVVELAPGRGRHAAKIAAQCERLVLIDVNQSNIDACSLRFRDLPNVECLTNSGADIPLPDGSVTSIFCFDSMVHFELDAVAAYLDETARVLKPGGHALFHHSNYDLNPGAYYMENPHARNFMTTRLFQHLALRSGLEVLDTVTFGWGGDPHRYENLDGLTLMRKPAEG